MEREGTRRLALGCPFVQPRFVVFRLSRSKSLSRWTCALGCVVWISACDAPVEDDEMAFRSLDADQATDLDPEVDDDEDPMQGFPDYLCEECGNYWVVDGDMIRVILRKRMAESVLPLSGRAKFFFVDRQLQQLTFSTKEARFFEGWYILTGEVRYTKPAEPDSLHTNPRVDGEEAVLRLEHELASVDLRLDRYRFQPTQQQTPAEE